MFINCKRVVSLICGSLTWLQAFDWYFTFVIVVEYVPPQGCVQEEIMFCIRPELLVSTMLCSRMEVRTQFLVMMTFICLVSFNFSVYRRETPAHTICSFVAFFVFLLCTSDRNEFVLCLRACVNGTCYSSLQTNEAILMYGSEQYSVYSGYGWGLQYAGNYVETLPR